MASIEKRTGKPGTSFYVSIRRKDHPPVYECFDTLKDAKAFVARTEANIAEGKHFGFSRIRTLADLIDAFEKEARPSVAQQTEPAHCIGGATSTARSSSRTSTPAWSCSPASLMTEPVKRHIASKEERPRSGNTVGKYLGALHQALAYGVNVCGGSTGTGSGGRCTAAVAGSSSLA